MLDDDGDIDHNGIPDSIQRDPVVVSAEPVPFVFGEPVAEPGLPGIDAPIETTAEAPAQPMPEPPVRPPTPPALADEATMAEYERSMVEYHYALQKHRSMIEAIGNISTLKHDMLKGIIENFRV